jgi:hypothetical protein
MNDAIEQMEEAQHALESTANAYADFLHREARGFADVADGLERVARSLSDDPKREGLLQVTAGVRDLVKARVDVLPILHALRELAGASIRRMIDEQKRWAEDERIRAEIAAAEAAEPPEPSVP